MDRHDLTDEDIMSVIGAHEPSYRTRGAAVYEGSLADGRRLKVQVQDNLVKDAFVTR